MPWPFCMRKVWPSDEILHKNLLPRCGLEVDSGIVVRISFSTRHREGNEWGRQTTNGFGLALVLWMAIKTRDLLTPQTRNSQIRRARMNA